MSKTIKQIADELGVSKQAVFKKIKQEPLSTSLQGLTATVDGENLVKQAFAIAEPTTVVVGGLTVVIDLMKQQLEVKDRQIEQQQSIKELTAALENTTQSLKAAQLLHAGTMHQQLENLPPITGEPQAEVVAEAKKQTWLQKVFHTK